jgi:hypothetical protein
MMKSFGTVALRLAIALPIAAVGFLGYTLESLRRRG